MRAQFIRITRILSFSEKRSRLFQCPLCTKSFSNVDNFKNHVENVHPEPENNQGEKEPLDTSLEEDVNEEDLIIDEQPIKLKLNLGAVGAVPGSRAGAVGAVPGSRTGGGPGGRPSPAGGPKSPSKKPLKVKKII